MRTIILYRSEYYVIVSCDTIVSSIKMALYTLSNANACDTEALKTHNFESSYRKKICKGLGNISTTRICYKK